MHISQEIRLALRLLPGFSIDDSYSTLMCYKYPVNDEHTRGLFTWLDLQGAWNLNARVMPCIIEDGSWSEHYLQDGAFTADQIERMKVLASEWVVQIKDILRTVKLDGTLIIDTGKLWQW